MVEVALSILGLAMLVAALSRIRRELYGTGLLMMAAGLMLLLQAGISASKTGLASSWLGPALCAAHVKDC